MSASRRGFFAEACSAVLVTLGLQASAPNQSESWLPADYELKSGELPNARTEFTYDSQGRLLSVVVRYGGHG